MRGSMPLWMALAPVVLLVTLLGADVVYFGEDSSYGSNQIALLLAALFAGALGMGRGTMDGDPRHHRVSIGTATEAILILLLIGALSGTWLLGASSRLHPLRHDDLCNRRFSCLRRASFAPCCPSRREARGAPSAPSASPWWASAKPSDWRKAGSPAPSSAAPTLGTRCRR